MQTLNLVAKELFNKIRGRFPSVTIGDGEGNITTEPEQARFYDFDFKAGGKAVGKISISLEDQSVSVVYNQGLVTDEDEITKDSWYDFLKELRQFAKKRMLNFDTRDINKSNLNRRDYKFLANNRTEEETMSEGKLYGTSKLSYQDFDSARLVLRHSQAVNQERAAGRTQHVESIYIESSEGERFKYPYKHINGARAMARHVAEGGKPFDEFGIHIVGLSEELSKLKTFKSYMGRSSVMAEGLSGYMDVVKERVASVKKTLESLQKKAFYTETFTNYAKAEIKEVPQDVAENWIDELTVRQFNEELKDVFPYIYSLVSENTRATTLGPMDLEGYEVYQGDMRESDEEVEESGLQLSKEEMEIESAFDDMMGQFAEGETNEAQEGQVGTMALFVTDQDGGEHEVEVQVKIENGKAEIDPNTLPGPEDQLYWDDADIEQQAMDAMKNGDIEFDEGDNDTMDVKIDKDGNMSKDDGKEEEEQKTPLGEFILSYFDRENGQFPKGETAVLTMVEKDYGEEFITPAKKFIEMINTKVAEVMGYKEAEVEAQAPELVRIRDLAGL